MKRILTIVSLLFALTSFAQDGSSVVNALKAGNATQFSSFFSNVVDLKFPQKPEMKSVSKADAATATSQFFSDNKLSGFELTSQREMSGTMYIAGKLTGDAKSYNITVMLKSNSIITVRIN